MRNNIKMRLGFFFPQNCKKRLMYTFTQTCYYYTVCDLSLIIIMIIMDLTIPAFHSPGKKENYYNIMWLVTITLKLRNNQETLIDIIDVPRCGLCCLKLDV